MRDELKNYISKCPLRMEKRVGIEVFKNAIGLIRVIFKESFLSDRNLLFLDRKMNFTVIKSKS